MNLSLQLGKLNFQLGSPRSDAPTLQRSSPLSPIQAWLRGEDWIIPGKSPMLASPFQQSVWVYTAISTLAQTVSAIPFRIARGDRSGENVVTHGPLVELFNRPHPYLNRFRFWESVITWYCLRGEAFLVALDKSGAVLPIKRSPGSTIQRLNDSTVQRLHDSTITSLLVLNPDQFRHLVVASDLVGWRFIASPYASPLRSMDLLPEEVLHDYLPNPYLFWRGMSPLSVAMLAAQTDYASAQFMKGLMLNNADAGVIVRTDPQLAPEQREQMMAALKERKSMAGTADRPVFLWGATEVVQPSLSSADLQFLENRKMNRQEICAAFFRIPQSLVGFTENANRSIAESERLNFIENSITPLCARLEAAVEPIVKSFGADLVGWFDIDSHPILQQARRTRVDAAVKLFGLGYPANAINKALDLGLPHLSWGDKGYLAVGWQEVGAAAAASSGFRVPPVLRSTAEGGSSELAEGSLSVGAVERMLNGLRRMEELKVGEWESGKVGGEVGRAAGAGGAERAADHAPRNTQHPSTSGSPDAAWEAGLEGRIREMRSRVSGVFFEQRKRVLGGLVRLTSGFPAGGVAQGLESVFNLSAETKLLCHKLAPLLKADVEWGFAQAKQGSDASHPSYPSHFTPPLAQVDSFLAEREKQLKEVNQTTFDTLHGALDEGLQNGERFPELAARVRGVFQEASDSRAELIARAETTLALNYGRALAMEGHGLPTTDH